MNEEELEARKTELDKIEAALTRRELEAEALQQLTARGLPKRLAKMLDYTHADACAASIEVLDEEWRGALKEAVTSSMRGTPPKAAAGAAADPSEKIRAAMGLNPRR